MDEVMDIEKISLEEKIKLRDSLSKLIDKEFAKIREEKNSKIEEKYKFVNLNLNRGSDCIEIDCFNECTKETDTLKISVKTGDFAMSIYKKCMRYNMHPHYENLGQIHIFSEDTMRNPESVKICETYKLLQTTIKNILNDLR